MKNLEGDEKGNKGPWKENGRGDKIYNKGLITFVPEVGATTSKILETVRITKIKSLFCKKELFFYTSSF